jgi:pimeloyl-ACP methyl ester carboxylesterase
VTECARSTRTREVAAAPDHRQYASWRRRAAIGSFVGSSRLLGGRLTFASPRTSDHLSLIQSGGITMAELGSVVLVHGGFVDGSGWQGVYDHLKKDGYKVSVVQNPTLSHADDVAVTKRAIDAQNEPVILVGHSYGGAVITEAGNHPKVAALVYIAAFAPDKSESVNTLIADPPPGAPGAADSAAAGRVSVPRPGKVPCFIRRRPERRPGDFHGRLTGSVGR